MSCSRAPKILDHDDLADHLARPQNCILVKYSDMRGYLVHSLYKIVSCSGQPSKINTSGN